MQRDRLVEFLDHFLESPGQQDFGPNGLQVQGREEVRKIVTSVSACLELFERAAELGADAVLVHHGIFWDYMSSELTGMQYHRVKALMENEINLIAYHLPLDRHGEVGNNILAARAFGLEEIDSFAPYEGEDIGFHGTFDEPIPVEDLLRRCGEIFGQAPQHFDGGPDPVSSLGIISGGAQKEVWQAIELGLDAYLTGEPSEWVMNVARENHIHYLATGHYAGERLGVKRLGEMLEERFELEVEWVNIPNPV